MKVIVTGGAGYIGSHTIIELISSKITPIIIDNLCNSNISNINGIKKITEKKIKWYNKDCSNKKDMYNIFENEKNISGVIHFAAYKSVEESIRNPKKYYDNNVGSLEVLLDCMNKYNVNNLVFSSSCTVYGNPDILPVDERALFKKAESPYAETKQLCEKILKKSSINSVSLRYFNPIGAHESGLIGDCSADKPANLVPIICEVAKGVREKLIINGKDYKTIDGTCVRDYINILDLAESHVKALCYLIENKKNNFFNIGTGIGLSVLQVVDAFEKANKIKVNFSTGNRRIGDVEEIYSDNKKAKKILNWEAKRTIKDAMKSAWKWQLNKTI
tara:strand:- start:915 stop:1907 length:993 start_codon:yes stop_codon:yes gene_type:complete